MCFPAFPIVCDAQEPFADHPVIECEVLLITAVKIVETGLPGIVPAIVQAPEPTLSENIIKLQITDNHILSTMQSKSKSF